MTVFSAFVSFTVLFFYGTNSFLLEPKNRCLPTTVVEGPCHQCVCTSEGIYHCRKRTCVDKKTEINLILRQWDCQAGVLYIEDTTMCICSNKGIWRSTHCNEKFNYLHPKSAVIYHALRANIQCSANKFYLVDCNICRCDPDGTVNTRSCTNRLCSKGHKADKCEYGDVLRTADELCFCDSINYYLDRRCLKVGSHEVQEIDISTVEALIEADKMPKRTGFLDRNESCKTGESYKIDCNNCYCIDNAWACTGKTCSRPDTKNLRTKKEFLSLPIVSSENEKCTVGRKYRYKCNSCICYGSGLSCTTMLCLEDFKNLYANVCYAASDLPKIKDGESCIPNKKYRLECNTCVCTSDQSLICTNKGCRYSPLYDILQKGKKQIYLNKTIKSTKLHMDKAEHETIEKNNAEAKTYKSIEFTELPSGKCKPGKLYKKGCKICYCEANGKGLCSQKCLEPKERLSMYDPEDFMSDRQKLNQNKLTRLPSLSAKCKPGNKYIVDCNTCMCLQNFNLFCSKYLCLSYEDMNRIKAEKFTGNACENGKEENLPCVNCKCVDGKQFCEPVPDCVPPILRQLHGKLDKIKPKIDLKLDNDTNCLPTTVYKENCNKCYCQDDHTLRCTQKTCLNFLQVRALQHQRIELLKHGL